MATTQLIEFVNHCVNVFVQQQGSVQISSIQDIINSFQSNFIVSVEQISEFDVADLMELSIPQELATVIKNEAEKFMSTQMQLINNNNNMNIPLQSMPMTHRTVSSSSSPIPVSPVAVTISTPQHPNEFFYSVEKQKFQHQFVEPLSVTRMIRDVNRRMLLLRILLGVSGAMSVLAVLTFSIGIVGMVAAFVCSFYNTVLLSEYEGSVARGISWERAQIAQTVPWIIFASVVYFILCLIHLAFWVVSIQVLLRWKHHLLFSVMASYRKHFKDIGLKTNIFGDRYLCVTMQ